MSRKYVLYQTQAAFASKRAIGVFSREELEAYVIKRHPDGNHLVLESGFFGKLKPIKEVFFLRTILRREENAPLDHATPNPDVAQEPEPKIAGDISIRKLTECAREYLTQRVKGLSDLIARTRAMTVEVQARGDPNECREFDKFLKEFPLKLMQKDFESLLSFLGYHEAWAKSEKEPVQWTGTPNSAKNFFGQPVDGLVFLYCNTFYEIAGESSVEIASAQLEKFIIPHARPGGNPTVT